MSYSVIIPCGTCGEKKDCLDGVVIRGAVEGIIHQMHSAHLGSGVVTMQCENYVDEKQRDREFAILGISP